MKAIKVVAQGKAEVQDDVPVPGLRDGHLLVKISHVALNPADWKHIDFIPIPGATVGCDWAGTVEDVGPNVSGEWKKGDRVAGVMQGCNPYDLTEGAFAEYAVVMDGLTFKLPDKVTNEEAATVGVAFATVGLALYQMLSMPWPGSVKAEYPVLIYGGSSATGSVAIQFAKLSGATVFTTCLPQNFEFVKSLGADEVFDYTDPQCGTKIREYTKDQLHTVLDCIGGETGTRISTQSISSRGGQVCSINPGDEYPRDDVRKDDLLAYKLAGRPWKFGVEMPATLEDHQFGKVFFRLAIKLMGEGTIKAHPPKVAEGLDGVLDGLDELRNGRVSGVKLVYKI